MPRCRARTGAVEPATRRRARGSHERTPIDDLAPLRRDERAPGLIALGLHNAPHADALPAAPARSPLLPHLKLLASFGSRSSAACARSSSALSRSVAYANAYSCP